jgi:putative ABC transport system ATP-binding protein
MNAHEPAVICRDVIKTYGKGEIAVHALKGVSLEARFGELLMIVGPSGCGKTTLLSVICGTLRADSGTIELFGKTISSLLILSSRLLSQSFLALLLFFD